MDITRPVPPDPYSLLPERPYFTLTSTDFGQGETMPFAQSVPGGSISPQLSWHGFPAETKSFALNCFDPDAPGPAGWWHWTILDIPLECTSLPTGAGESDLCLDGAAFHLRNDCNSHDFTGAAPPEGDYPHRYYFVVHALDVETLGLDARYSAWGSSLRIVFPHLGQRDSDWVISESTFTLGIAATFSFKLRVSHY